MRERSYRTEEAIATAPRARRSVRERGRDRFLVRQSKGKKRGTVVAPPKDPRLMARLAAGEARRTDWKVSPLHLLMNEQGRKPWTREAYHDAFSTVRAAAVAGVQHPEHEGSWLVPPCPSLKDFTDQDLRDTAVTWLALAGATIPEICAVTGIRCNRQRAC